MAKVPVTVASLETPEEVGPVGLVLVCDANVEVETKLEEGGGSKEVDIVERKASAIPTHRVTRVSC